MVLYQKNVINRPLTQVGRSFPRVDGRAKATGSGKYCADISTPNMLYGKLLHSPYAHAEIVSIDTSEAEKIPGVVKVITAKDVPDLKYGISPARWDENVLCVDKVLFNGDKVAAVACVDEETCYKALDAIKVVYKELPAVLDYHTAGDEGQPQIHAEYANNINAEIHQEFGDLDEAFEDAYYTRKDKFVGQRTYQCPIEPHSALCEWTYEGGRDKITVTCSTQSVHYFQHYIAREFSLEMGQVRIIRPLIGAGFGGKLEPTGLEYCGCVLSRLTGRPVRMYFDRYEMFQHNRGRHQGTYEIEGAYDKDGHIRGIKCNFLLDGGAYTSLGIATAYYAGGLLTLTYDFENYKFDMKRMYTNLPSCGAQRGHGAPQPKWAFESHLDNAAQALGIRPDQMRLINARKGPSRTINGFDINSCHLVEAIEMVKELSGYEEKWGKMPHGKGIGIATGSFVTGAGYPIYRNDYPHASCVIRVNEDGTMATLYSMACDIGQGSDTVLLQMGAEGMGYKTENMRIVAGDTETCPLDFGAYSSRQTLMCGWACKRAGEDIKEKILETAGFMLHLPPEDLLCENGMIWSMSRPKVEPITFESVAKKYFIIKGPLVGTGVYTPPKLGGDFKGSTVATSPAYSFCSQVIEVDVDTETGMIEVVHGYDVHDAGTIVNPRLMSGQVHGAFYMGLGESLYEEIKFRPDGSIWNGNLANYRIFTAMDMPDISNDLVPVHDEPAAPWGIKEVGEGSNNPTMGAIRNAVVDAIGVNLPTLPFTSERVWQAIQEKKASEGK